MRDVPRDAVIYLEAGPQDTLVAGFQNGFAGVWSIATGDRLLTVKLATTISDAVVDKNQVHVVSAHGQHVTLDLGVLARDYCDVLREVWKKVPVIWSGGDAVPTAPDPGHRCFAK